MRLTENKLGVKTTMIADQLTSAAAAQAFKQYGYTESDFADRDATTQLSGIRIHSTSDSGDMSQEFDTFKKLQQSDWTIESEWSQRLVDGTILFEGRLPEVSQ